MIKLTTANNEHIWVSRDRIVLIEQAKTQSPNGPVVVLGMSLVTIAGAQFPLVIKGNPESIANLMVGGGSGGSSLFPA